MKLKTWLGGNCIWDFTMAWILKAQASTSFNQVRIFTPGLSLESSDLSEKEQIKNAAIGETITLEGQEIKVDEKNKTIHVDGFPIAWVEESEKAKEVSELKLKNHGRPSCIG